MLISDCRMYKPLHVYISSVYIMFLSKYRERLRLTILVKLMNVCFVMRVVPMDWRGACGAPIRRER